MLAAGFRALTSTAAADGAAASPLNQSTGRQLAAVKKPVPTKRKVATKKRVPTKKKIPTKKKPAPRPTKRLPPPRACWPLQQQNPHARH